MQPSIAILKFGNNFVEYGIPVAEYRLNPFFPQSMTTRRNFLKRSAAAVAGAALTPYLMSSAQPVRAQAASDRLRVGCVGLGGQGRGNAHDFSNLTDVVAICDLDSEFGLAQTLNNTNIGRIRDGQRQGTPDSYKDYRRVLERNDVDIVSIGTTDQWHVKIAVEALQAGKHVFCEKPLTLTIEECQLMRNAAKKFPNLKVQIGSQQRSQKDQFATACLMIRKGMLGDITKMVVDIGGGDVGGPFQKGTPPAHFDFMTWLGQCPVVEYIPQRTHGNYRWWYEYSGGKFTDWGAHHIDFAHWALNEIAEGQGPISAKPIVAEHPVEFKDGYPLVDDRFNTSHRFEISFKFANGTEMLVVSHSQDGNGILVEGTKGRIHVNRERINGRPIQDGLHRSLTEEDFTGLFNGKGFDGWHKRNFITCIKDGGLPVSDVFSHIQSMISCHLCEISVRLGRELKWDPKEEKIIGDEQAVKFVAREVRRGFEIPRV